MFKNLYNINDLNDLRESFNHLVNKNLDVIDYVKRGFRSEDYSDAVRAIDKFVKEVACFIDKAVKMAGNYRIDANYENEAFCLIAEKMAGQIIKTHLEVEKTILKKYTKKDK